MKRNQKLIDAFSYLMELEKPKTKLIKSKPQKKIIEKPIKEIEEYKKPLEINPIYRYTIDGELVDKYINGKQLANKLGWNVSRVNNAANKETLYNGFLLTRTSYTKQDILERFTIKKNEPTVRKPKAIKTPRPKKETIVNNYIYQYNKDGELVATYNKVSDIVSKTSWNANTLYYYISREILYNGFLLTRTSYNQQQAKERYIVKKKVPIEPKQIKTHTDKRKNKVINKKPYIQYYLIYQYNKDGELVATYDNAADMAIKTNLKHNTLKVYCTKETVYNGFLLTRTYYEPQQAKERYTDALNRQQMTYIYKDGVLVATFSTLSQVKNFLNTNETLRRITYHKEKHKPIEGYVLSAKPL